jgi:hypothetical protein
LEDEEMALKFVDELIEYKEKKTRVLINGMGTGNTKGTILNVYSDFIEYELLTVEVEKNSSKTRTTREVKLIPLTAISELSEGETKNETTPLDGLK